MFVYLTGPASGSRPAAHLHLRVPRGQERSTVRQASQVQDAAGLPQELRLRQVRPAPQDLQDLHGQFSWIALIQIVTWFIQLPRGQTSLVGQVWQARGPMLFLVFLLSYAF